MKSQMKCFTLVCGLSVATPTLTIFLDCSDQTTPIYKNNLVTEDGLHTMTGINLSEFLPGSTNELLLGKFRGLSVMAPYSKDPLILTTRRQDSFIVVCMVGMF